MMNARKSMGMVFGLVVGFAVVVGLFLASTWQPDAFARGSFAHWLFVPSHLDEEVVWDVCAEPVYTYRARDGESPEFVSVSYGVSIQETSLDEQIEAFSKRNQCVFESREVEHTALRCATEGLYRVWIIQGETSDACQRVGVDVATGR